MNDINDRFTVRPVTRYGDFTNLVEMQQTFGGLHARYVFPDRNFSTAIRLGGAALCLFDEQDKPRGFIFHFPGSYKGEIIGWSFRLVVDPTLREQGFETRLKKHQREQALVDGLRKICWTFDPFNFAAARRNLALPGAMCTDYLINFAERASIINGYAYATDCLLVEWNLAVTTVNAGRRYREFANIIDLSESGPDFTPEPPNLYLDEPVIALPLPADVIARAGDDLEDHPWRRASRRAFAHYLKRGYRVVAFLEEGKYANGYVAYVLEKGDAS